MAKTIHVTLANYCDVPLTRTEGSGSFASGFEAPDAVSPLTVCEWQTEGDGTVSYRIGDDEAAVLSIEWSDAKGGGFNFALPSGWEFFGTVADGRIDLRLAPTTPHVVDGFAPSVHGFAFPNDFPEGEAVKTLDLGIVKIPIGKASNGLCGGMAFGARDFFEANTAVPADQTPPSGGGNALFEFLTQRLLDTFDLPHLPTTLLSLMNPLYPDHDGGLLSHTGADGRARLMGRSEFAKIREAIDAGKPCPICIVKAKSASPAALGENHQILIYGYQVDGTALTLWAYDPNNPGRDDAGIVLDIGRTDQAIEVSVSIADLAPIYCYIVTNYQPAQPPAV